MTQKCLRITRLFLSSGAALLVVNTTTTTTAPQPLKKGNQSTPAGEQSVHQ